MENNTEKPLVSVIVPIYKKEEKHLRKCIESLLSQTMREIEIILVDDGSPDNSGDICDHYAKLDARVSVIHQNNGGVSSARNSGLQKAQGHYISFVDADDWVDSENFKYAYEKAEQFKADIVFWCYTKEFESKSVSVIPYAQELLRYDESEKEFDPFYMGLIGSTCFRLYSANLIEGLKFRPDLKNGEDVEFNFRAYQKMDQAIYLNLTFYHYRQLGESAVRGFNSNMREEYENTIHAIHEDIEGLNDLRFINSYYTFVGLSFLLVVTHFIFASDRPGAFSQKRDDLKRLATGIPYAMAIENLKHIYLSKDKKLALWFAKRHCYLLVYLMVRTKQFLDRK